MKKLVIIIAIIFVGLSNVFSQTITVTSPNGGETWAGCSSKTITWTHSGTSGFFNVEYSSNNGATWASLANNYNGTSIAWTVPNISSSQALVRVYDFSNNTIVDQSNAAFTITPSLIITQPDGGEVWQVATGTKTITWDGFGTSNSFLLEYSINGGSVWTTIISTSFTPTGNTYSYNWTLPNNPSNFCLVRVTDNGSPACKTDVSNTIFQIAAPTPVVNITSPNGGNTLYINQNHTITWSSAYLSGSFVKIEYSTNNGSTWNSVINSVSNTGSYVWNSIPNTPSNSCLVKVSDAGNLSTYDVSDAVFNIVLGSLNATYPNGGETVNGCQSYNILWSRTGTSNYFNLDYTLDNGISWSSLATNYYQTGTNCSFAWTVPNVSSNQARVRVSDFNNNVIIDSSDAVFTINPALVVTSPNGGETWQGGTSQLITWTQGPGASNYWTIEYSTNSGNTWTTIVNNTKITTGQYSWNPVANAPSTNCLIRVYDYQSSSCRTDVSDNLFTITPATPVITVSTPNGGNLYYVGTSYNITWSSQYLTSSFVKLEYSIDNGSNWLVISNSTNNDGSEAWVTPNTPSANCLVRVSEFGNPTCFDVSNAVFTIVYPYVLVTAPNGGENIEGCSSKNITWTGYGAGSGPWKVERSANNGVSWATLIASTSSTSYTWDPVTNQPGTQNLIRVTKTTDALVTDLSDANFNITLNTSIIVSSPNGGESWQVANPNTRLITWSMAGASNYYNIYYSTNNGISWTTILSSTYITTNQYNWTIPNIPSTECWIKVEDYYNNCKYDISDLSFEIVAPTPVITVTAPNTGSNYYVGTSYNITWTSQYVASPFVKLEYSIDNGTNWITIASSTNNDGSEAFMIPNTPSTNYIVRVSEYNNPSVFDISNVVSSIVYPYVIVTSPSSGEIWNGCSALNITWNSYGAGSGPWKVEYSLNNGASWNTIVASTTSTNYTWTPVPNTPSTQTIVRVTRTSDALVTDVSNGTFTITPNLSIIVNAPNGGESWLVGGPSKVISWAWSGTSSYYNLYYSIDNGATWITIVTNQYITTGQYTWTIPNNPSAQCLIKVEDYNNNCKFDISDVTFTIEAPTPIITVNSPNGGNNNYVGTSYSITWSSQYLTSSFVKIEYSTDGGTNWSVITNSTANDGSETWVTPNTPSNNCLVRVSEFGNPSVSDVSNVVFNIIYPYVLVTSPNGGESWEGCSAQSITWTGYGAGSGPWKVEYSLNNGTSWTPLIASTTSSSYTWAQVPNSPSTQTLVRVTRTTDALVTDVSNSTFTITPNTSIIVTSPNGGESWQVANPNTRLITWSMAGASNYYNIYYSTNNGTSWNTIVSGTYITTNQYNWTIPNIPSTQCLILVEDYYNTCKYDISDLNFTIVAPTPVITVTAPNTGSTYYVGTSYNINWTSQYLASSFVKIEYSTNNGSTWSTVFTSTNNDGSESWVVPNTPSNSCLVRVSEYNNPTVFDESNIVFNIVYPYVIVTAPNGGESWEGCSSQNITWNGYGASTGPWKVEYSLNNGTTWATLIASTTSSTYTWNPVPNTPSTQSIVRVTRTSDALVTDNSNTAFTISPNTAIVVTSPNGFENWQVANPTTKLITWTMSGASNYYNIYYSTNNGTTWTTILSGTYVTTNQYVWTIPNLPSTQCLIKVEDYYNNCKYDISDANFTILAPTPVITVTAPNGNNIYYVGTSYNITWSSQYLTSSFVKLEYSTDNGATWLNIASSTNNDGSEAWVTPNTPSTNCLVRVSEYNNPTVNDVSNAVFNIVSPYITVNSPNGGESLSGCLSQSISWSGYGTGNGPYKVEYTTDNGASWVSLINSTTSSSYSWNPIPNISSNQALVRVSLVSNSAVNDVSNANFSLNEQTYIIVNSPNGSEEWQVANPNSRLITWASANVSNYYNIYYSTNGGISWSTIISSTNITTNQYNWTIPNNPSNNVLIKIEDYYNNCKYDVSDSPFSIVAPTPTLAVTYPNNAGVTLYSFNNANITWTSSYLSSSYVKIEYSADSMQTWQIIASSANNTGSYAWTVPNISTTKAFVRVTDFGNNSTYDINNNIFTIKPAVIVTAPNGSEDLGGCTVTSITWQGENTSGNYLLQYSINGGSSWTTIVNQAFSGGPNYTYNWTLPNTASNFCLVKVTNTANTSKTDQSDNVFNILPTIVVTNPNNGGSYAIGSNVNITWDAQGVSNYYNLEYSINGTSTWNTIAFNQNITTNSYNWTVPNAPSSNCFIRVTDNNSSCKQDVSNIAFTIATTPASVTVTSPNGGENWTACSTRNITWSSNSTSGTFNIDYSANNGSTWTVLASNYLTANNVYTWTLPSVATTQGLIRIKDASNGTLVDQSNTAFTISTLSTPGAITGNSVACQGSVQSYSVALVTGATSYTWTLPSGWVGTSTSNTINVTAGNTNGNITVVANNSCGSSLASSKAVTVTLLPATPGLISGTTTPCVGISQTYNITAVSGATSYTWILPLGYSGSSTTNSINVVIGSIPGNIEVAANNSCGSGTSSTLAITPSASSLPAQPGNISGITNPCIGSSQTYTVVPVFGATSYTWTIPGTWTGTSTSNTITLTVGTSGGNITATANNTCGSSAAQLLAVTTSNVTAQPGVISGNATVCLNSTNTYSISAVSGATSYDWTLPIGWTGASNSNSIVVSANGSSGTIQVVANNGCGASTPRNFAATVTNPVTPSVTIVATPTGTVCPNSSVTFVATPVNGGTTPSYQWIKNNVAVGTSSASYSASSWSNNDSVWVILTSNLTCVTTSTAPSNKLKLTVIDNVTPTVVISTANNAICAGQSVTFNTAITNGGTTPGYQWKKNGTNISGATLPTYTASTLINNDNITVVLTSNATCASPTSITSNSIVMSVTPNVTPSINIAASPTGAICAGTSVSFTATPTNGGTVPTFNWTVNGLSASSDNPFVVSNLINSDVVRCILTSDLQCVTSPTATSNMLTMTVNAFVNPSVAITANNNPTCIGQTVLFTATPTYGGTSPMYQWRKNSVNISGATSATYSTNALAANDIIDVIITSNYQCLSTTTATSNQIMMDIVTSILPSVTIAATPSNVICAGTSVNFTTSPVNGGTSPSYQWKKNGVNISGATLPTYTASTLVNNDVITVVLTSNAPCASPTTATSNGITMSVTSNLPVSVSIAGSPSGTICSGTPVTYTATPTNGGTTPFYQWKLNGANIGTNSSTYTNASLTNGQTISCKVTSSLTCVSGNPASSNTITATVTTPSTVSVSIAALPSGQICAGTNVTFTTTPINGGTTPSYQWKVNGGNVGTGNSFSSSSLTNGNIVTCEITSNATCVTGNTATSNSLTMIVNALPATPTISLVANTFTSSSATNNQWLLNNNPISGATSQTYSPVAGGNYSVMVTNAAGCTAVSAQTAYTAPVTYCTPVPTTGASDGDFIDGVVLGTINNTNSGSITGPSYNNYTSMSTILLKSTSYTVNITSGSYSSDQYAAWIDYNGNGSFSDTGEKLGEFSSSTSFQTVPINFTVPATAVTGTARMRVRAVYGQNLLDPCTNYSYGETEDYSVVIQSIGMPVVNFSAANTTVCAGSCINFSDLSTLTPTSWLWSFPGAVTTSSTIKNPTNICYNTPGTYSVTLTATNANGSNTLTKTAYITVISTPTAPGIITGTSTVCQGQNSVSYTVPSLTGATSYIWLYSGTGSTITGTGNTVTISYASTATSGNLTVKGVNTCGTGLVSANYAITVNSLPANAGTITGTATVCQGQNNEIYTVPAIANATSYTWTYSGTGANISGSTNSVTINFASTATSGNLTVRGVNSCGNGSVSANYAISINPLPGNANTITGTNTVCLGQNAVSYSTPAISNTTSYLWSYSGTGATITGTTNNVTISFSPTATSGNLTVRGVNACGNGNVSTNYAITVNHIPSAAGTISGSSTICQGQNNVAYTVPSIAYATNYTWLYSGTGATITGTGNNVTLNFASNATPGNLTVEGINSCGNGVISANYAISINPLPENASTITGTSTVCQGQTNVVYTVPAIANATAYTWSYSGTGAIITGTTNSVSINFASTATSGNLTVRGINACGNGTVSANFAIIVNPLPAAPTVITGTQTVCVGENAVTYTIPSIANALSYDWSYDGTGAIITGTNNSVTIDFSSNATSGNLTVRGVNGCGNGNVSANYAITVTQIPSAAETISGSSTVCQGQNNVSFTVPAITNATSHVWTYDGIGATITGTTNSVTIDFASTATSGNLTVTGLNACGNGMISQNYAITVNPLQETPIITPSGVTSFCNGDSIILSSNITSGNVWSNSSTQNSIIVNSSGSYFVVATNLSGCSSTSATTLVTVYPNPVPVISLVTAQLVSTAATSYQWYFNGVIITNATSQTYTPESDGLYTVSIVDENGCSGLSQPFSYITIDISNSDISNLVLIYPNPTTGSFEIICPTHSKVEIYDMLGKLLKTTTTVNAKSTIDVSEFATGIYSIKVSNSLGNHVTKLIRN